DVECAIAQLAERRPGTGESLDGIALILERVAQRLDLCHLVVDHQQPIDDLALHPAAEHTPDDPGPHRLLNIFENGIKVLWEMARPERLLGPSWASALSGPALRAVQNRSRRFCRTMQSRHSEQVRNWRARRDSNSRPHGS